MFLTGPIRVNTPRPRQTGRHLADDIFKYISLKILVFWITKFVPKSRVDIKSALVQLIVWCQALIWPNHYSDVMMGAMAFQITSLTIVYSAVYSGADQRKHQSSASLAFVRGIHRSPVNSPHKCPVMRKRFPFDDVIMIMAYLTVAYRWLSARLQ